MDTLLVLSLALAIFIGTLLLGAHTGIVWLKERLLEEGFKVELWKSRKYGEGRYELFRCNAEGNWVRIKNVE